MRYGMGFSFRTGVIHCAPSDAAGPRQGAMNYARTHQGLSRFQLPDEPGQHHYCAATQGRRGADFRGTLGAADLTVWSVLAWPGRAVLVVAMLFDDDTLAQEGGLNRLVALGDAAMDS